MSPHATTVAVLTQPNPAPQSSASAAGSPEEVSWLGWHDALLADLDLSAAVEDHADVAGSVPAVDDRLAGLELHLFVPIPVGGDYGVKFAPGFAGSDWCDIQRSPVPRLYYMPRTRSSRVLWLLAEIDADYELVKLAPEERRSPEHRKRHPLGRVPALELDDGTFMFESAAICLQLADLHPEADLIAPIGSSERALIYQWVLFAMTELEAPLFRWIRDAAEDSADPSSRERFAEAADALQNALDGREWLVGDRFTVADVMCASVLGGAHSRGLLTEWPGLQAYVERGEARPAFIRATAISNQPRR